MDWKRVVKEIQMTGLSERQVAEELRKYGIDVTHAAIRRYKLGVTREPAYSTGVALLRLRRERIGEDAAA